MASKMKKIKIKSDAIQDDAGDTISALRKVTVMLSNDAASISDRRK